MSAGAGRMNAYLVEKENLKPEASAFLKPGTLPIIQKKMAMKDTSQKAARERTKYPRRSLVKLGQRKTANPRIQEPDKSKHPPTHGMQISPPHYARSLFVLGWN